MPGMNGISPQAPQEDKSVDWQSIMLYGSGNGGTGTAQPGNDQRALVLVKHDGSRIEPNLIPSERDLAGLRRLYSDPTNAHPPNLPNEAGSSDGSRFMSIFRRDKGPGCI